MKELIDVLKNRELTLSCAESLTAGMFASTLAGTPGVSAIFKGGVVTYWNESKEEIIKVPADVIRECGVVSAECASWMARGVKKLFDTDVSISFTGNAGPAVQEGKPVGLVYIGICLGETTFAFEYQFEGKRNEIRKACVKEGIRKLLELL